MTAITVLIPVSPYHLDLVPRALASVRAQTIPCQTAIFYDEDGKGAGYARNQLLAQCNTDLLIFLDADDELLPTFAEKAFTLYERSGRYVYTDWQDETGKHYAAPDCAWIERTHHLITTLLPTAWARAVGGFDESLPAGEDTEFYCHLVTSGHCGVHLAEPLVTYTHYGQRSKTWFQSEQFERVREQIELRYKDKVMGCCDDNAPVSPVAPEGEMLTVVPTWGLGKRKVIGMATGKDYGRIDSTYTVKIDRRDVEKRPDLFRVIADPQKAAPAPATNGSGDFHALVSQLSDQWGARLRVAANAPRAYVPEPAEVVAHTPNVERVLRLAGAPTVIQAHPDPIFVFPAKDYPSYTDIRHLIELSGFQAPKQGELVFDAWENPEQVVVFLAPEQPTSFVNQAVLRDIGSRARLIWWSLEYGGEYEPDLTHWKGEVWASDPAWAKVHGAKFVLMGSHPGLYDAWPNGGEPHSFIYDATMLGYMTPRRDALKAQLSELRWPAEIYPGYGKSRHQQLAGTRLMLHAHQDDARQAIAPQRFALCAAYHLPLIHETVPDEGAYAGAARFERYDLLAAAMREELAGMTHDPTQTERGEALHQWLCVEKTFRRCVEEALK